jgi:ATPase subunit of ABC transporter with duplicated ATPase domains
MRAKDVLLNALEEFTGTVVFVSHDRYFIDKLATRVFEVGGGRSRSTPATTRITCGARDDKGSLAPVSRDAGPRRPKSSGQPR